MANPDFGSVGAWTDQTTGTTLTLAAPASIADGDILLAFIRYPGAEGTPPSLTGWALVDSITSAFQGNHNSAIMWKRASSESGSYAFTVNTGTSHGFVARFTSGIASGDPWTGTPNATTYSNDGGAGGTASGSVTPAVDEALMIYWLSAADDATSAFTGGGLTWTERVDTKDTVDTFTSTHMATAPQATAGAVDGNCTVTTGGFRNAHLIALAPAGGGGGGGTINAATIIPQLNRRKTGRFF